MDVAARLKELGIVLPPAAKPVASYVPVVLSGNLAFVSGQIARKGDHVIFRGKVGEAVSVEQGYSAARECALSALAAMEAEGLLDRIARVVKLTGYVASAPGFADQPKVVNGASDLLVQVFGDQGRHARAAVGVAALPLGASVEVEFVFEVR
ncbi:MAG: RidA family protein [Candidatus Thermoplasmatota archaeon]